MLPVAPPVIPIVVEMGKLVAKKAILPVVNLPPKDTCGVVLHSMLVLPIVDVWHPMTTLSLL